MSNVLEKFEGKAFQGGAAAFHGLASQLNQARTPLIQSDVASIKYWVRNLSTNALTKDGVALTVSEVLAETLDDVDSFGKNFHMTFPDDSFPTAVAHEVIFEFVASDTDSTKTYGKGRISVEAINIA